MTCLVKSIIYLCGTILPLISSKPSPFFRRDYTYVEDYDAHYKIHWDKNGLTWNAAFLTCDDEGAALFYPKAHNEWSLAKTLAKGLSKQPNITDIFVGLHDKFRIGEFITIDGHRTESPLFVKEPSEVPGEKCVLMNIETGVFTIRPCLKNSGTPFPFVCKKVDDKPCPTIDPAYKYIESSKKCYKVNEKLKTWDEAMQTCFMEGGVLAVLENENQAESLRPTLNPDTTYYVGIRRTSSQGEYYSVKGTKLDRLYERKRSPPQEIYDDEGNVIGRDYEPDTGTECGAVYVSRIIYTTTADCNNKQAFICEMEARG